LIFGAFMHFSLGISRKPSPPARKSVSLNGSPLPQTWCAPDGQLSPAEATGPLPLGLLGFLFFTLLSLGEAAHYYLLPDPGDYPNPDFGLVSAMRALGVGFGLWYPWGVYGLFALRLSRRFPLETHHWPKRFAVHLAASIAVAALKLVVDYPIIRFLYCPHPEILTFPGFFLGGLRYHFLRYVLYYWAMIGAFSALEYYRKYRDGELRAARLETGLARARLQLLKSQLQPHFLFNTLNAISALVHADVEAADRMLVRLGDLLRLALEDFGLQEAPLARELEAARAYLEIEQARLGPRLQVEWSIDPDIGDALVPTFLLQPLIENAVNHGIAPRRETGRIDIRIRREGAELHLEVRDDGPGFMAGATVNGGVGLANTRARLLHLYGTAQRLDLFNGRPKGCIAKVILPFHEPDNSGERHDSDAHRR
jgi:hypothetical protein